MPFIAGIGWVGEGTSEQTAPSPPQAQTTSVGGGRASAAAGATSTPSGESGSTSYSDANPPNFNEDKAGWVRHYYGEEYLEDGKYPRGILIDHGEGQGGIRITGYRTTPETHPWLYPGPGDVHTNGKVYPEQGGMYDNQGGFTKGFQASPEEIRKSHDRRNYFKTGQGLPPALVRTMVDDRSPGSPYWQRMAANAGKPPEKRPYPSPEEVTGPYGRYFYQRPNYVKDPHTRATDYEVGYSTRGIVPSRFISNGVQWDPENQPEPPEAEMPPSSGGGSGQPPPNRSGGQPPPEGDNGQPPSEPPSTTQPTQPGPAVSTTVVGPSTAQPSTPGAGQADPMAMVQQSGMLSAGAPPISQTPAAAKPPGMLSAGRRTQPQQPVPRSGMFGT